MNALADKLRTCPNCGHVTAGGRVNGAGKNEYGVRQLRVDSRVNGCPNCGYIYIVEGGVVVRGATRTEWEQFKAENPQSVADATRHIREVVDKRYWG